MAIDTEKRYDDVIREGLGQYIQDDKYVEAIGQSQKQYKPSGLTFQASCIRDVLTSARSEDIRKGLEAAISTLTWLETMTSDLNRLSETLNKENMIWQRNP